MATTETKTVCHGDRASKIEDLFTAFEDQDLKKLQQLVFDIQNFDRDSQLKRRPIVRDKSAPRLDLLVESQCHPDSDAPTRPSLSFMPQSQSMMVMTEQPTPCDDRICTEIHITEDDLRLFPQKQPLQGLSLQLTDLTDSTTESTDAQPGLVPLHKEGLTETRPSCVQCGQAQFKRGGVYACKDCPQPVSSVALPLTDLAPTTAVDAAQPAMTLESPHQLGEGSVESRPRCKTCGETGLERSAEDLYICENCQQMEIMYRPSDILESLSIYDSKELILDNTETHTELSVSGYATESKCEVQTECDPPGAHIQGGDSIDIRDITMATRDYAGPVVGQFEREVFQKDAFHVKDRDRTTVDSDQESENSKTESHEDLGLVLSL